MNAESLGRDGMKGSRRDKGNSITKREIVEWKGNVEVRKG